MIAWLAGRIGFDEVFALVARHFAQAESRRRALSYVLGLLSGAERKNSWTLAEQAGDLTPDGMRGVSVCFVAEHRSVVRFCRARMCM